MEATKFLKTQNLTISKTNANTTFSALSLGSAPIFLRKTRTAALRRVPRKIKNRTPKRPRTLSTQPPYTRQTDFEHATNRQEPNQIFIVSIPACAGQGSAHYTRPTDFEHNSSPEGVFRYPLTAPTEIPIACAIARTERPCRRSAWAWSRFCAPWAR